VSRPVVVLTSKRNVICVDPIQLPAASGDPVLAICIARFAGGGGTAGVSAAAARTPNTLSSARALNTLITTSLARSFKSSPPGDK
jgi:hypothetical protein